MSQRQHVREPDRTRLSGETNGQDFRAFYQENVILIYRFVRGKVGNREEAEDLTSQVFLKTVRSMNAERSPQAGQKWRYQVARTTIADYWRNYSREPTGSLDALLDTGWNALAAGESALDGAARRLGVTEANVKVLQFRALKRVADVFSCGLNRGGGPSSRIHRRIAGKAATHGGKRSPPDTAAPMR